MTRDEVIRLAREAGFPLDRKVDNYQYSVLHRFVSLVAAVEREECAKACKDIPSGWVGDTWVPASTRCADAIRARGNDEH